jgi:thiamine biosynthesis lipoprotein
MGTTAELVVDGGSEHVAAGFARLRELEARWSRFEPRSELNELLRRPCRWVCVSNDLLRALRWARRMFDETDGIFDPSIRDDLETLGYDRTFRSGLDSDVAVERMIRTPRRGLWGVELDSHRHRARVAPGLSIDLGGIGKGLAADIVAAELVANGARAAYISVGGDIAAHGEPPDVGWPVPLLHPITREPFAFHLLDSGGVVMSSTTIRRWQRGDAVMHHIIDPRSGEPSDTDVLAVAVAARSAARAEALAKAAIVLGSDDGATMLADAHVRAWIVTSSRVVDVDTSC